MKVFSLATRLFLIYFFEIVIYLSFIKIKMLIAKAF